MGRHNEPKADFEDNLDAYAAAVKPTSATSGWRTTLGNWPVYAAATGSALALSTSAGASIIHGFANLSITTPIALGSNHQSGSFTIGPQTGTPVAYPHLLAFHLQYPQVSTGASTHPAVRLGGVALGGSCGCTTAVFVSPASGFGGSAFLRRFASGEMISSGGGASLSSLGFLAAKCAGTTASACPAGPSSAHPNFQSNVYGFAGFKAGDNFGWIRIKWESDPGSGFPVTVTVLDWAYDDTGAPIAAGAIPEPGTMSMGLLAAGAAGILAWRKRKKCVD